MMKEWVRGECVSNDSLWTQVATLQQTHPCLNSGNAPSGPHLSQPFWDNSHHLTLEKKTKF